MNTPDRGLSLKKDAAAILVGGLPWEIFPKAAQKLILAAVTELSAPDLPAPVSCIRMQRFYDPALLKKHRSLLRFCSRTAAQTEQRVIALLSDALQIHDDLESYYIRALNPAFLDRTAEALMKEIAAR